MKIGIWYTFATDVTALALAKELSNIADFEIETYENLPEQLPDLIINWGGKPKDKNDKEHIINRLEGVNILNTVKYQREAVNKIKALKTLIKAGVEVPQTFFSENGIFEIQDLENNLPIIGRKAYHQGGEGFYLCLNKRDISRAIQAEVKYFQSLLPIKEEYRVHVFNGKVIGMAVKVERQNPRQHFINELLDKFKGDDNGKDYYRLGIEAAAKYLMLPDPVIHGLHRGWVFKEVDYEDDKYANIGEIAVNAVKALNLDFSGVDIILTDDDKIYLLEANTCPGLSNKHLKIWVTAFEEYIRDKFMKNNKVKKQPKKNNIENINMEGAAQELVNKLLNGVDVVKLEGKHKVEFVQLLRNIADIIEKP